MHVCVCVRERGRVCVREIEREGMCVCVCEREGGEYVCMCAALITLWSKYCKNRTVLGFWIEQFT